MKNQQPSQEELSALPYLDAVVRETLRVYPPVTAVLRVAASDDILPVSESFRDRNGTMQSHIRRVSRSFTLSWSPFDHCYDRICKGNRVVIPIMAMNQSRLLWGEDALDFK